MKTQLADINFLSIKYDSAQSKDQFFPVLKGRIDAYFSDHRVSKFGNTLVWFKIVLVLILFTGSYALLVSNHFSPAAGLLLGIICGLSHVLIVMNIGHDAGHNALSPNTKINHLMCWAIEFTGLSHYMWKLNHNVIHHPYPNVRPVDSELNMALPYLRLGNVYPKKWFHRFQHIYAPFIYLFFTINLIFIRDIQDSGILPKESSQRTIRHFPLRHYVLLFFTKLVYIGYALIIPMIVLSIAWWKVLMGFVIVHFVMSIAEMCIQLPLHINEETTVMEIDEKGVIPNRWYKQMLEGTTDYWCESKVANFLFGGINTHTVHHIFPGICHVHYVALTKILADTSQEFGMPYHSAPWLASMKSHFRKLKQLAKEP